jgi:hypothetical protein
VARSRAAVAALALAACQPFDPQWRVDWNGHEPAAGFDRAMEVIEANAPCSRHLPWSGDVTFYPDPFECYPDFWVHGCMPAGPLLPTFAVGYRLPLSSSALPDEVGHYMFVACGLGIGEDAGATYTPEFTAWLGKVRAALTEEGL